MGIINSNESRALYPTTDWVEGLLDDGIIRAADHTGVGVTSSKALTYPPYFAALQIVAQTTAAIPLPVYQEQDDGEKLKVKAHPAYRLLMREPNIEQSPFDFISSLILNAAHYGNAYAVINRADDFTATELLILESTNTKPVRYQGELFYAHELDQGEEPVILNSYEVLHIRNMGLQGMGIGWADVLRQSLGLGLAAQEHAARFFKSGASVKGLIEHPGDPSDKAVAAIRRGWNELHSGLSNSHKTVILREGMTFKPISISPKDSMMIEARAFDVKDVARVSGVPLVMLAENAGGLTYATPYANDKQLLTQAVEPWLLRLEQECNRKLFSEVEKESYYVKANTGQRLRADTKERYESYNLAFGKWLDADDIRRLEDLPSKLIEPNAAGPAKPQPEPTASPQTDSNNRAEPLDLDPYRSLESLLAADLAATYQAQRDQSEQRSDAKAEEPFTSVLRAFASRVGEQAASDLGGSYALPAEFLAKYQEAFQYRAAKVDDLGAWADYESRRARNAFARLAWEQLGASSFRWLGGELNGQTAGKGEAFSLNDKRYLHPPCDKDCTAELLPIRETS